MTFIKSISLPGITGEIAKDIPDFSKYVQNCIQRDYSEEFLKLEIKKKQQELDELNKKLSEESQRKKPDISDPKEKEWIENAKERVKKYPAESYNIWETYNKLFGKRITLEKFREMLE
jgi:hypothetical protein